MSRNTAMSLVAQFLGRQNTIPIPVPFVQITGDYTSAAFLAQCLYWGDRTTDPDGWFHKSHEEWAEELLLSADQVRRCVKSCGEMIEVKRKGVPARNYYRANREAVAEALENLAFENQNPTTRCGETQHLEVEKPHGSTLGNPTTSRTAKPTSISKPTTKPTQSLQTEEEEGEAAALPPPSPAAAAASQGDQGKPEPQTPGGADRAEAPGGASAANATSVTDQDDTTADAATHATTTTEKVPGAGGAAARPGEVALRAAMGDRFYDELLAEDPDRVAWGDLTVERVAELRRAARAEAKLRQLQKWRTPFIALLDREITPDTTPTITHVDDDDVDMDALIRSAPLNGYRRKP
ncbi:hypothetical protein [Deinococcus murrayi]|uniref:hypothetical protein n=1 Tax=Deinococcus murrayi TaxID=68910 RepID=UPI0004859887|nr:hypothetical protein [Deinococcus murrayi]